MKQKILFIINPISGDIQKANLPHLIEKNIDKQKYEPSIRYSERKGHAKYLAEDAVKEDFKVVVAVGGDGSISEVAAALVHTDVKLGIIALGSGNGLAHHLNLPIRNVKKSIQIINKGNTVSIDTGTSNHGVFLSFAGAGIESQIARTYSHFGKRGFFAYAFAAVKDVFSGYESQQRKISIDGEMHDLTLFMFTIYNAKYLGYKVGKVEASLQDGYFQLLHLKPFPFWKLLYVAILLIVGKIHLAKEATIYKAKEIVLFNNQKTPFQKDGDAFISSQDYHLKVVPHSLNVIIENSNRNF